MLVYVNCDERYPDYTLSETPQYTGHIETIEITPKEWADYQRVLGEYEAWSQKIRVRSEA